MNKSTKFAGELKCANDEKMWTIYNVLLSNYILFTCLRYILFCDAVNGMMLSVTATV